MSIGKKKFGIFLHFIMQILFFLKDIPAELDFWERYWTKQFKRNLPTTISDTLDALNELIHIVTELFSKH